MRPRLQTVWQGMDLVVKCDDQEVDRLHAADIQRVIIVYRDSGSTPGDLAYVLVQTREHDLLFPPESGIAGRVHFERLPFWNQRRCVYWAPLASAPLPRRLCSGLWVLRQHKPGFVRLPCTELRDLIGRWPLEGPQTWDERKWERIARLHPFAALRIVPTPNSQH
jgi:hypothetical protein